MKQTRISRYTYNKINEFPKVKKTPHINEVWLALFPYEQLGNMEKLRPVLITKVMQDNVKCKKITTNANKGKKIKGVLSTSKYFNQPSYLSNIEVDIPRYKLYGRLRNNIELEETEDGKI